MPELPEVETVVRGLRQTIVGRTISRTRVLAPSSSAYISDRVGEKSLAAGLRGRHILAVQRRGKNILIRLSGGCTLWVHLKMTGFFFWVTSDRPIDKHDLFIFDFEGAAGAADHHHLRFNDYRRFGRLRLFRDDELWQQEGLRDLGPEPLEITAGEFISLCRTRTRMIKPALLDQTFLAGLGNIYADESLYYSRIHPRRLTSSLSHRKLLELHGNIQRLLKRAIRHMGTSVNSYTTVYGRSGGFQKYLRVYKQEGTPCERCGTNIVREKIGSRSARFCPRCQRLR
jgi:formamidopyrimidine-DNA glycosylase